MPGKFKDDDQVRTTEPYGGHPPREVMSYQYAKRLRFPDRVLELARQPAKPDPQAEQSAD